jgi:MFS family permease
LRRRSFRLLLAGRAISSFGDRIVLVALSFAVLSIGSVGDLGIVLAAQSLPLVLFLLAGGVWADRLPRQLVMLSSDGVRALTQALSAALLFAGVAHVWELAALQALYGAAEGFFLPASTALVPQTVAPEDVQAANALLGLADSVAYIAGPALAGVLVASAGAEWGLAVDAVTFLASAACLGALAVAPLRDAGTATAKASLLADLRDGWRAFSSHSWMWVSVLYFTLYIAFCNSPFKVLGPVVSRRDLGGAGAWAAITAALGAGALAGGLIGLRWRPRHPLRANFLYFLLAGPPLFAFLAAHLALGWILAAALLDGAAGPLFNTLWFTAQQSEIEPSELSRVSSWDALGTLALEPLGLAITGPVAALLGVSATLYGAAGLMIVLTLAVLAVPAVRNFQMRAGSPAPAAPAQAPAAHPSAGPAPGASEPRL